MRIRYIKSEDPRSNGFDGYIRKNYPQFLVEKKPELILVTGGDGALLHAIQKYNRFKVPFLGHAAGTLNYLMNTFNNPESVLESLCQDKTRLQILETKSIKVDLVREKGRKLTLGQAVNEVVMGSTIMGYHKFQLNSQDGSFKNFDIKGSGICISSDLGSTGFNFNLGGPVIPLGSNLWTVTGVVCNRHLNDILNSQKITITCDSANPHASIFLDGIENSKKPVAGDSIVLNQGDPIYIAFLDKTDFIQKRIDITSRYRKG